MTPCLIRKYALFINAGHLGLLCTEDLSITAYDVVVMCELTRRLFTIFIHSS